MSVKLDQIDILRERANVSYQDAKDALEKCNYDIVEALIYLEKENKVKSKTGGECKNKFISRIKSIIQKGNMTSIVIKKDDNVILSLPLTIFVILAIVATPVVAAALILAIFTNHKIRFEKKTGENIDVNGVINNVTCTVNNVKDKFIKTTWQNQ